MLLMKTGEQGWLQAGERGNHEFARVYWMTPRGKHEPQYILREGAAKLGGIALMHAEIDQDGLWLTWDNGARSQIPKGWYQYTWVA